MSDLLTRRRFTQRGVGAGFLATLGAGLPATPEATEDNRDRRLPSAGNLVLNDDGHVFLYLSDDLGKAELRRYMQSYCSKGVDTVAYCVGDMSWPTFYPSRIGEQRTSAAADDFPRLRAARNLANFAREPGSYFGAAFTILHDLGKKVLASFRMNDVHVAQVDNPHVSAFWKKHAKLQLGAAYGYYGGGLNYASEVVRSHFFDRVAEFVELYPAIDGIELDAMRSPY